MELSYKGTNYHGWQRQPNANSVQEVLEKALSLLLKEDIQITGAGRTDAGVHAKKMFAHFDFSRTIDAVNLVHKLNSFLPWDIAIHKIHEVIPEAHARFDAFSRSYEYHLHTKKNPFLNDLSWEFKQNLDIEKMNRAASVLLKHSDFKSFSKSKTDVKTYICDIREAYWEQKEEQLIFHITADRFLRNMVRAIVGTLIEIGRGKMSEEDMEQIIEKQDRSKAGFSVPAHGLYLTDITYPQNIFRNGND